MNLEHINRNILGIEYPGIVKNDDYMLKTLGGLTNISKVVSIDQTFFILSYLNPINSYTFRHAMQTKNA